MSNKRAITRPLVQGSLFGGTAITSIASAGSVDLSTAAGMLASISGTTTITAFTGLTVGAVYLVAFEGALTLTHHATNLILPGGNSITTAAGDTCVVVATGTNTCRIHAYQRTGVIAQAQRGHPATFHLVEDFSGYITADGYIGALGWRSLASSGSRTGAYQASSGTAWGVFRHTTGTSTNNDAILALGQSGGTGPICDDLNATLFDSWWRVKLGAVTNAMFYVGFHANAYSAATTGDFIGFRFDTGSADANFMAVCRSGGSTTATSTTAAPSAATWYSLRAWSEAAGTIKFRVHSATGAALGSEISISTYVPATALEAVFYNRTLTTAALDLDADLFSLTAQLAR